MTISIHFFSFLLNGKRIRVGQYKNLEDAINARKEAEITKMNIESQPA